MSNKLFMVLDHIEGDQPDFNTLKEAEKYIEDSYSCSKEGIHHDVENMLIVKVVKQVKVERDLKVKNQEVYNLTFKTIVR